MSNNTILLSLCIPTYNRVGTLTVVLERVVHDPDFNEEVEIVISDNCSTDDTEAQIRRMASEYPNIKYYRNSENVQDRNFYLALSRGRGRYLKLLNDYILFKMLICFFIRISGSLIADQKKSKSKMWIRLCV